MKKERERWNAHLLMERHNWFDGTYHDYVIAVFTDYRLCVERALIKRREEPQGSSFRFYIDHCPLST